MGHSKGNVILTDHKYSIVTLLRTFKPANSDILIATNHLYPMQEGDYQILKQVSLDELKQKLESASQTLTLKQFLMKCYDIGTGFIQHCILEAGLSPNVKLSKFDISKLEELFNELKKAEDFVINSSNNPKQKGWIIMRNTLEEAEERKKLEEGDDESKSIGPIFDSFVPFFYVQYKEKEIK